MFEVALLLYHLPAACEAQAWSLPNRVRSLCYGPEVRIISDWLAPELHHTALLTRITCLEAVVGLYR